MTLLLNNPEPVARDHYLLTMQLKNTVFKPGQFISIKTTEGTDPLLRRPFSIFDADGENVSLVVRVIGKGTELICNMKKGGINVIGPSGNGFTMEEEKNVLLVGGGVGNAPLYYLLKELKKKKNKVTYIYCARSENFIFMKEKYKDLAERFLITTDDGTDGIKGIATVVMADVISMKGYDRIYTCGPDPMMEKIVKLANINTPVEVSVENYFGCGVGLCVGCTVDTVGGYKRACIDGPVFDGRTILWERMPD
jgi:dihydroorotate dehydrogenase electron transfer subunit